MAWEEQDEEHHDVEKRDQWVSKTEYFLATAGTIVGLGNVWRFPYLCYRNGGGLQTDRLLTRCVLHNITMKWGLPLPEGHLLKGAFLIPYVVSAVVLGIPLFLLDTIIGQYTQEGIVTCWRKLCPLAQGLGYAELLIHFYGSAYIIVLAWSLFYLVFSLRTVLPWASCGNIWNTDKCVDLTATNHTVNWTSAVNTTSAAIEFWERRVLAMSGGIEEMGSVRWELLLCLLACWAVCYFSIWKGVRSTGKVVYFTATFPYVMLLILLVRGLTLPGAWDGVYFYLYPDLARLADHQVWLEAGNQVFFSYSVGAGNLLVLGSFNKNKNNCYKDCLWLSLLNSATSFVAGFAVFSVLGFMAQKQGVPIEMVVESGPGLAFIVYPQAVAMMPLPQLWAVCFFIMLFLLGVDSQFVTFDCITTSMTDLFPMLRRRAWRELFILFFCVSCLLTNMIYVTQGGIYAFQLIEFYACNGACIFFMAMFESLVMGWIVGADRVCDIMEDMTGQRPNILFRLCWRYLTPLACLGSIISTLVDYRPLRVDYWYVYPDWAYALGLTMALSSILLVPAWGIGKICVGTGSLRERLSVLCRPEDGLPAIQPGSEPKRRYQDPIRMEADPLRIQELEADDNLNSD